MAGGAELSWLDYIRSPAILYPFYIYLMITPAKTIILIPTYNEVGNIGLTLDQIYAVDKNWQVLVLDDASPDGTVVVVKQKQTQYPNVHILERTSSPGFAQSYLDGFEWVKKRGGYEAVVTMDADFSHEPKELPALLQM